MTSADAPRADAAALGPGWARRLLTRSSGFGVRYALIAGVAFAVYAFPFDLFGVQQDWLTGYLAAYARAAGALLGTVESGVSVSGTFIHGRFPLQIVRTCDAAEVSILFGSAVLAFPGALKPKALAFFAGLACITFANLVRICSLYYVGVFKPDWFKVTHEEVWPLVLVALAAILFLACARYLERTSDRHGVAAAS